MRIKLSGIDVPKNRQNYALAIAQYSRAPLGTVKIRGASMISPASSRSRNSS
ncbi:hypothetical protein IF2G_07679 [Cordyceps javanica]|nr:hypothetical protein IF2G_07679 [Cordyceps javanica]